MAPVLAGIDSGVVTATGVQVAADGRVVPGADSVEGVSQSYQFLGTKSIYVTYVLSGAMELSTSVEGRALARVTALDLRYLSMGGDEPAERARCRGAQPGLLAPRRSRRRARALRKARSGRMAGAAGRRERNDHVMAQLH